MSWFEILAAVLAFTIGLMVVCSIGAAIVAFTAYKRVRKDFAEREANLPYGERLRRKYGL